MFRGKWLDCFFILDLLHTAEALSFTHKFTETQTDVSDAVDPDLYSRDRDEKRLGAVISAVGGD